MYCHSISLIELLGNAFTQRNVCLLLVLDAPVPENRYNALGIAKLNSPKYFKINTDFAKYLDEIQHLSKVLSNLCDFGKNANYIVIRRNR